MLQSVKVQTVKYSTVDNMYTFVRTITLFFFFLLPAQVSELSLTGRDQTGYTVHAGFCMFPQSYDLRTETAESL
jgi:hypothetical protein